MCSGVIGQNDLHTQDNTELLLSFPYNSSFCVFIKFICCPNQCPETISIHSFENYVLTSTNIKTFISHTATCRRHTKWQFFYTKIFYKVLRDPSRLFFTYNTCAFILCLFTEGEIKKEKWKKWRLHWIVHELLLYQ